MKNKIETAIKALQYYADGWHYRLAPKEMVPKGPVMFGMINKAGDAAEVILENGHEALRALHKIGGLCNRGNCRRCSKVRKGRIADGVKFRKPKKIVSS